MKKLSALLLAVLIGHAALGQTAGVSDGLVRFGASASSGGGSGTVTSVGNGTLGPLFAGSWANATSTPAFSLNLVASAANCVIAGPATGADAVPTCRALVVADVPALVGDSGSGGTAGIAPAPAAGDAAKGLVLLASGAWGARPRVLFAQTATVTITNSTAETTLVGAGSGSTTLTGGTAYVGQTFRVTQAGTVDDKGNFLQITVRYKLGSVTLATISPITQTFGVTPYGSGIVCTVRTTGASGTLSCVGLWKGNGVPIAFATPTVSTIDFTTDQVWGRTDQMNVGTGGVYSNSTFFTVETY